MKHFCILSLLKFLKKKVNDKKKIDMSTTHQRLKSPWSLSGIFAHPTTGWETKIFRDLHELGSLLYSLYKIPLAQACFQVARPNFRLHWRAGER